MLCGYEVQMIFLFFILSESSPLRMTFVQSYISAFQVKNNLC